MGPSDWTEYSKLKRADESARRGFAISGARLHAKIARNARVIVCDDAQSGDEFGTLTGVQIPRNDVPRWHPVAHNGAL